MNEFLHTSQQFFFEMSAWPGTQTFDRIAGDPRRFEGCQQKV